MEYFILTQDSRIISPQVPNELTKILPRQITSTQKDKKLVEAMAFPINNNQDWEYSAIIDRPVYLVNTGVKDVLSQYDRNIWSTPVMFNDMQKQEQHLYWLLDIEAVDCLAAETVFNPNRTLRKLVLDEKKIAHSPIFKIGGLIEEFLAVRLDVAESLLRRELYGIELKSILINQ